MKSELVYIEMILDSAEKIESFIKDFDLEKFLTDRKTQSAVIMQLILVGETSRKISEDTKLKINLPWPKILGLRNSAVHEYFDISLETIWDTIIDDIPTLKKELQKYLDSKK